MSDEPESSTTTVTTVTGPTSAVADAASLIAAVATLVANSTQTITSRLDENARGAAVRWQLHDDELERNRVAITAKFEKIERSLLVVEKALETHLDGHHDDDLVMDARVRPVRTGIAWAVANYKNIVILLIGILGFIAVAADIASRYLGGGT